MSLKDYVFIVNRESAGSDGETPRSPKRAGATTPRRGSLRKDAPSMSMTSLASIAAGVSTAPATDGAPLRVRFEELQQRYDALQGKYDQLANEADRARETNILRVRKLNDQIEGLSEQLKQSTTKRSVVPAEIVDLNGQIKVANRALSCLTVYSRSLRFYRRALKRCSSVLLAC